MLDKNFVSKRFHDSDSHWIRSFSLEPIKCLIVCRGPVRRETMKCFDELDILEYGMLLSEKDSVVYPKTLAPELRDFRFPKNVHRVPDYMGATQDEKVERIREIIQLARKNGYTHVFAGYGFMAEDAEFIEAIESAGLTFMGPSSHVARHAGAKDEAKKLARAIGASVTPGVDNVSALALLRRAGDFSGLSRIAQEHGLHVEWEHAGSLEDKAEALLQASYAKLVELVTVAELQAEAELRSEEIWARYPGKRIRFKYIGGGGGKGQRVVAARAEVASAVLSVLAESKVTAPGSNRNFLIELNIENTRHNEIQLIGNGTWCLSLGGRDCSLQMHEQKLLEVSLTREMLDEEIVSCLCHDPRRASVLEADKKALAEMEEEAEKFGVAVRLNSVSTFESIVEGTNHFFMEMNTRIQVEHRVTEMVYRLKFTNPADRGDFFCVDSLIEAMALLSLHGKRLPRPERVMRNISGAEVRINATNQALQPHAGGTIIAWSSPLPDETRDDQGIGTRNPDTGAFVHYHLAGAYDSNIALVITHGTSRRDNLERLAEILRRTELRGQDLQTNLAMHYGLISWILGREPLFKPSTQFMGPYLAAVGSLAQVARDVDLEFAWADAMKRLGVGDAKDVLRRKQTLLLRPIDRLFANPHLLAGFIGLGDGRLWTIEEGRVSFLDNPVRFLSALYHYLNLEEIPEKPASEKIWDHDQVILGGALSFYDRLDAITGLEHDWKALDKALRSGRNPEPNHIDDALFRRCAASHNGFQLGLELLLLIPKVGMRAGFCELGVDERLEAVVPAQFVNAGARGELIKALAPPPKASSDEIVTPMGGHFFSREAPNLPPIVAVGDHFAPGQPLFIIEVMKMFNKIHAPFGGTVERALLPDADGKIVKKGEAIFKIVPDEVLTEESPEDVRARQLTLTQELIV